jgi:hypothetical protein
MTVPISYRDDRRVAEKILLDAAQRHTVKSTELSEEAIKDLEQRYVVKRAELAPRVFFRITDNWLEMTVRFICEDHGIRALKDAMTRDILRALDEAKIGIASATFEIVGAPRLNVEAHVDGASPHTRAPA